MDETYKRTPQDLAHEYESAIRTIRARQRRCPATPQGLDYSERMEAIGKSLDVCLSEPGVLVQTAEQLAVAEQALIDARAALAESLPEFQEIDTARAARTAQEPTPQVVTVAPASREPIAKAAGTA